MFNFNNSDVGVMHLNRLVSLILGLLFLSMFFITQPVAADDIIKNQIEAEFNIEMISATDLKISITLDVNTVLLTASGMSYEKEDILTTSDPETMGAIKYALKGYLTDQIQNSFENAKVTSINPLPSFDNILFYDEYAVNLTSEFFGMNETVNAQEFVNGILDMGANITYSFDLQAEHGWNNTYVFDLGDTYSLQLTNGEHEPITDKVTWIAKNEDGDKPTEDASLKIKKTQPTTSPLDSEDIFLEFEMDSRDAKTTSLTTNVIINSADVEVYNVLPSFIGNLKFIPADGFRLFVNNSFFTWNDTYQQTVKPIEDKIIDIIENSSFNQTLDLIKYWDNTTTTDCPVPYETQNMDNAPHLKAILKDENVKLKICDISNRALFGLINAGAEANISEEDVNFGDDLNKIGYDYNVTLFLPENIYLNGSNIYFWNESITISGEFESDGSVVYSKEKKETIIEVEIKSTDLNLLSVLTGNTELTFGMYLQENRNYNVTNISERFNIPEKVVISLLNSDAFRLCIEENVFSSEEVEEFLNDEKNLFEDRMLNILPGLDIKGKGNIKREVFDESIQSWDGNISKMDDESAVKIDSYAHTTRPVSVDFSFLPPSFEIPTRTFNFTGIKNHNVTYRIYFSDGMTLSISDSLNKVQVKKTGDGRSYIEVRFNESECNLSTLVSCKITLSALFITGIFIPCIISVIITIILVIVIFILRKKRRIGKSHHVVEDEDVGGYAEEDYYVPPPPGSK